MVFQCTSQGLQSIQRSLDLHAGLRHSALWTLMPWQAPGWCKGQWELPRGRLLKWQWKMLRERFNLKGRVLVSKQN